MCHTCRERDAAASGVGEACASEDGDPDDGRLRRGRQRRLGVHDGVPRRSANDRAGDERHAVSVARPDHAAGLHASNLPARVQYPDGPLDGAESAAGERNGAAVVAGHLDWRERGVEVRGHLTGVDAGGARLHDGADGCGEASHRHGRDTEQERDADDVRLRAAVGVGFRAHSNPATANTT